MPKYLWKASYSVKGAKGVATDGGTSRRDVVERAAASVGGKLEGFYFAFGGADAYVIAELPDNETAAAIALAVNGTEGAAIETVVLLTPEEMDAASKIDVEFRPAGG